MSGAFFGIFQSNQTPVDAVALASMDRVMAGWGPDAHGQLIYGSLALASRLLKVTAEDESEQLPLQDGPHILAARVRLDNRRELCARLRLVNHQSLPDSRLILEAYRQYGLDCVQYLMGDWSFAIWDDTTQTLMIARDASGNTGVYYWWDGKKLVFSNGIKAILVHPDFQRQLDPLVLAGFLTMYGDPEVSDATLYQGIKKILPGQMLLMRQGALQIRRWWQPEQLGFLRYDRVEDCYADFVTLYDEVVGECLRIGGGRVAATLSGGLDSGSVVSLAAPRLQAHGQSLTAFVHAPLYEPALAGPSRTGNELALAQATADHVGNTQVVPVRSEDKTLLWGMVRALEIHDAPGNAACHYYWLYDIQQQAHALGAKVLLMGQMGNATVSYTGHGSLWPLLRSGRVPAVLSALRQEESGLWLGLKRRILRPMVWPAWSGWQRWRASGPQPWADYSFIHPEFATSLKLLQRMQDADHDPTLVDKGDPAAKWLQDFRQGLFIQDMGGALWMESGASHGLDVRDPTRDRRLVEFCWRVPDDAFWASGRMRGLIREGMRTHLPASVLACKAKGLQSADVLARYQAEAASIQEVLEDAAKLPIGSCLDFNRIRKTANSIVGGEMKNLVSLHVFGRAVQTALFFRHADL